MASGIQWGTVGEWLAGAGAIAAVYWAVTIAKESRTHERDEASLRDGAQVLLEVTPPGDLVAGSTDRMDVTGSADLKLRVWLRNFSGVVLRDVKITFTWQSGDPVNVHRDKPGTEIDREKRMVTVPLTYLRPAEAAAWIEFGANSQGPDLPAYSGVSMTWTDRYGLKWEASESGLPRRLT